MIETVQEEIYRLNKFKRLKPKIVKLSHFEEAK